MFVSAGVFLKFHDVYGDCSSREEVYRQNEVSNIKNLSWSKDNCFITLVSENGRPEIISLKDPYNIRNVHTVSAITDASAISFQKTTKRYIGMATNSGQIALYDTRNRCISKLLQSVPSSVNCLDFNVDDEIMAASCTTGNILLYNVKLGEVKERYTTLNTSRPTVMECDLNEKHILSVATEDGTILQWDVNVGLTRFGARIHDSPVCGLGFFNNPNLIVSVGQDHKFCIHDLNRECIFRNNHQYPLTAADVSPDNRTIAVGTETGHVYVYDIRKLIQPLTISKPHNGKINKIAFQNKSAENVCTTESSLYKFDQESLHSSSKNSLSLGGKQTHNKAMPCSVKYANDEDGEFLSKTLKHQTDLTNLNSLKKEFMSCIQNITDELQDQLVTQISILHGSLLNDFQIVNAQIEDKWNLLNATNMTKDENVKNNCVSTS